MVPLYWDHGAWTERAAAAVEGLTAMLAESGRKPEDGFRVTVRDA